MELIFRKAKEGDIPNIVKLLADDELGSKREDYKVPLPKSYYDAFQNIVQDKNQELIILEDFNKETIGTLQITYIPYLTYRGGLRAQIEAVRIQKKLRGKGFGKKIFKWAIKRSKNRGAHLVQLTTDKQRPDAIEFYKSLLCNVSIAGNLSASSRAKKKNYKNCNFCGCNNHVFKIGRAHV